MASSKTAFDRFAQAYAEELGRTLAKGTVLVIGIVGAGLMARMIG